MTAKALIWTAWRLAFAAAYFPPAAAFGSAKAQGSAKIQSFSAKAPAEGGAAKAPAAETKAFPAAAVRRIIVRSLGARLIFQQRPGRHEYKAEWRGGRASVELQSGDLMIEEASYHSETSWDEDSPAGSSLEARIFAPAGAAPVSVFAFSANISFKNWEGPVFVSSLFGKVAGSRTKGPWRLSMRKGELSLSGHQGEADIRGFRLVSRLQGAEGAFRLQFNEGGVKFTEGRGLLGFATDKGEVKIRRFQGSLSGASQSGPVSASFAPERAHVSSSEGILRFYFMGRGARLSAASKRGKIYAPRRLRRDFSGKSQRVTGRLKGKPLNFQPPAGRAGKDLWKNPRSSLAKSIKESLRRSLGEAGLHQNSQGKSRGKAAPEISLSSNTGNIYVN